MRPLHQQPGLEDFFRRLRTAPERVLLLDLGNGAADAKLSIGGTWFDPDFWGTGINRELHQLVFGLVFETLGVNRAEIRVHTPNVRSLKAMSKLGLTYEGTLRASATARNGRRNDVAYFSMLADEWENAAINPRSAVRQPHSPSMKAGGAQPVLR